jgi:hypothetical protein
MKNNKRRVIDRKRKEFMLISREGLFLEAIPMKPLKPTYKI